LFYEFGGDHLEFQPHQLVVVQLLGLGFVEQIRHDDECGAYDHLAELVVDLHRVP
jgi:hypothetical protein